jgi:hypothetical protein
VRRILRGRAVLGEYQPRTRPRKNVRKEAGEAIPGYYPVVIDPALWHQANRHAAPQVRLAKNGQMGNLFTKLIFDGATGAPMRFRGARGTGLARLINAGIEKGDDMDSWSYDIVESLVLHHLERLDWDGLFAKPADAGKAAESKKVELELDEVRLQLRRAVDFVTEHRMNSGALAQKITLLEQQEAALKLKLEEFEASGSGQSETEMLMREAQAEFLGLVRKGDPESRSRLRAELAVLIKRIDLWSKPQLCAEVQPFYPLLEQALQEAGLQWTANPAGWPCFRITFANGECRWVLCERSKNKKRKSKSQRRRPVHSLVIMLPKDKSRQPN